MAINFYLSAREEALAQARAELAAALQEAQQGLSSGKHVDLDAISKLQETCEQANGLPSNFNCAHCKEEFDPDQTPHVIREINFVKHSDGAIIQPYGEISREAICADCYGKE